MENNLRRQLIMLSKRVMYAFLVQLFFCTVILANSGNAQRKNIEKVRISMDLEEKSLGEFFKLVESKTDFKFTYTDNLVDLKQPVSVVENNISLYDALVQVSMQTHLNFVQVNENIHVKIQKANSEDNSVEVFQKVDINVSGVVKDVTGLPLPGVTVLVKGTTIGTVTELDGSYTITAPEEAILVFSFVGYVVQEISVENQSSIDVNLMEDETSLDEVVVVGYGVQKKSDLTGSIVSLTEENFTQGPNNNALQLIAGRAAGVNISQASSAPGAGTKIQIRGSGSINGDNSVLVVVDGLPGIDPRDLSPDDIASIEVLKDASAAAIYGTRAANGVILITTKTGTKGDPELRYNSYFGMQSVANQIDVLNGRQYMEILNAIRVEGGQNEIYSQDEINQVGEGTNWQDVIFNGQAPVQNHQLSMSGGTEKSTYYAGLNYFDQQGLVKNSDFKKLNLRANLDVSPKEFLRFKFNVNYTRSIQNETFSSNAANQLAGPINSSIQFDPTLPSGLGPNGQYYLNDFISLDNPEAMINGINQNNLENRFYGTFTTEIEPVKGLIGSIRLGATNVAGMNSLYRDRSTLVGSTSGGVGSRSASDYSQWLAEFVIRYEKEFNKDNKLSFIGGTTFEEFTTIGVYADSRGFLSDNTGSDLLQSGDNDGGDNVSSSRFQNTLHGILGRVNYDLKGKYLLTLSFRADGTSRFSDENKYAFFPSGALAWRISDEPFFTPITNVLSSAKFRIGYGQLGNQGVPNFSTIQTLVAGGSAVFGERIFPGVVPARLPNPLLKWETTEEINFGFDFGFANDRIYGSVDYFIRNTKDQIFNKPIPSVVGFTGVLVNFGEVRNSGLEFMLSSVNINNPSFRWNSDLNFSILKNEVTQLPDFIPEVISGNIGTFINNYLLVREGVAMQSFYGFEVEGIFQTSDEIPNSAQPNAQPGHPIFKDQNLDGVIDLNDRVVLGNPFPDFTLGFSNSFNYKNFTLDVFVQSVHGIQTLDANVTESLYPTNEYRNRIAKYLLNRWTPDNPTNEYPSGVNYPSYGGDYAINSFTVKDASYFRLRTLTLAYNFKLQAGKSVKKINAYVAGDNLLTITDFDGFDPEASATGDNVAKVVYNSYPLARTIRIGLDITF